MQFQQKLLADIDRIATEQQPKFAMSQHSFNASKESDITKTANEDENRFKSSNKS